MSRFSGKPHAFACLQTALLVLLSSGVIGFVSTPAGAAELTEERVSEVIPGRYIVAYKRAVSKPGRETHQLESVHGFAAEEQFGHALKGFSAKLASGQVERLKANPLVDFVVADRPIQASLSTAALRSGDSVPPGIRRVGAATLSAVRSPGADVAVLDTGIDLQHPDLNVVDGKNCIGDGPAQDDEGHGTHVAGTIGALNNGLGVTGMAPGTRLFSVRVLGADGSGSWSSLICGIDWVTARLTDADPSNDIQVVNMSLGGQGDPVEDCAITADLLHRAVCRATNAGATFVVAAGNDSWDFDYAPVPDVPAAYPEVLTVTAMTDVDGKSGGSGSATSCSVGETDDHYASFSNFAATPAGDAHTIAGPGTCIRSTYPGGDYATMSGTSMATPHVAGALALCISEGPCSGMVPAETIAQMRQNAATHAVNVPDFGFAGDTDHPVESVSFGRLLWAGDSESPVVSGHSPTGAAGDVATDTRVAVSFSEPMDKTATQGAFNLRRSSDGVALSGTFSWSGTTMTFMPSQPLARAASYTAVVATGARDLASNPLVEAVTWDFTTVTDSVVSPNSLTVLSGSLRNGNLASLARDDGSFLEVASNAAATKSSAWTGSFSEVPNDVSALEVSFRGKTSATCSHTLSIWKWPTKSWTNIDTRTLGTSEIAIDKAVGGALGDLVSNSTGTGQVRVRARCTRTASSFIARTDALSLTYD